MLESFAVFRSSLLSKSPLSINLDGTSSSNVESRTGDIVDGVEVVELVPLISEVLDRIGVDVQCLSESPTPLKKT